MFLFEYSSSKNREAHLFIAQACVGSECTEKADLSCFGIADKYTVIRCMRRF